MNKKTPSTVKEAIVIGISILNSVEKLEIIEMGTFNCHIKCKTNFYEKIAMALVFGFGEENIDLLRDVFIRHGKDLNFIDLVYSDDEAVDVDAGMCILLMEIRRNLMGVS